jgi:hypothetical protein
MRNERNQVLVHFWANQTLMEKFRRKKSKFSAWFFTALFSKKPHGKTYKTWKILAHSLDR